MLSKIEHIILAIRVFFEREGWLFLVCIALVLGVLFWTCCFIGIAIFYYRDYRYKLYYTRIYPVLRKFIYEQILMENMFSHFPIEKLSLDLDKGIVRKVVRRILHEFIFTIGGEMGRSMRNLFNELGFDKEAQYEIRHSAKHVLTTVRSLSDLALMQAHVQKKLLDQLLESPKVEIRVAAYKYLLQVEGEHAFDHIFTRIHGITELDALDIYQSIVLTDYVGPYPFSQWLDASKSFAVNNLFMDLMVYYQQLDQDSLWKLINAKSNLKTVLKAVNSLGKLLATPSEQQLRNLYTNDLDKNLRVEIIKAIGRLGRGNSLDFLEQLFWNGDLPLVLRKHAYRSLIAQKPYSILRLRKIEAEAKNEDFKLVRYISNPMVHYI